MSEFVEGETVWVKATVYRTGGVGGVTMVEIETHRPKEPFFTLVVSDEILRSEDES